MAEISLLKKGTGSVPQTHSTTADDATLNKVTFNKNSVFNPTTAPSPVVQGAVYFDSGSSKLKVSENGTTFVEILTSGAAATASDITRLNQQVGEHEIEIIELQANATITPFTHSTLISDTFTDSTGYTDTVNVGNTTALFDSTNKKYKRNNTASGITSNLDYLDTTIYGDSAIPEATRNGHDLTAGSTAQAHGQNFKVDQLTTSLTSYYKFDETTGTTANDSQSTNHGTIGADITKGATGKLNTAFSWAANGNTGNKITIPAVVTNSLSAGSVAFWVNPANFTGTGANANYFGKAGAGATLRLQDGGAGVLLLQINGEGSLSTGSAVLTTGSFQHVVCTWSAAGRKIYVNGIIKAADTVTATTPATGDMYIGKNGVNENETFTSGTMDEYGFWSREISAFEIKELYNSGNAKAHSTFGTDTTYTPSTIIIRMKRDGTDEASKIARARIFATDVNGFPTGAALTTSADVTVSGMATTFADFTFTFASPPALTKGTKYVCMFTSDVTNSFILRTSQHTTQKYPDGNRVHKTESGGFSNETNDLSFDLAASVGTAAESTKIIECTLPSITGTVTDTQLIVRAPDRETGDSITYDVANATQTDAGKALDTKHVLVNLTTNPTKIKINLVPKSTTPTDGFPSTKTYALKLWKS